MSGEPWSGDARALLAALGGSANVRSVAPAASRLRIGIDGWLYLAMGDNGVNVPRPEGDRLVHFSFGDRPPIGTPHQRRENLSGAFFFQLWVLSGRAADK